MVRKLERGFVAVHAGAGHHPLDTRAETLRACKEACRKAYEILENEESSALDACVAATVVLEDNPITNAGLGSNLTVEEKVECDAGLMEGSEMRFAGVGCVRNVKNPIFVCKKLLDVQSDTNVRNLLVPPSLLASDGATDFAKRNGLDVVSDTDLVTKRSLASYRKALKTVATAENGKNIGLLDTVGVIVVDNRGRVAASCSSGGPLLKLPGRIGHAAHFGCGVWAQSSGLFSTAVSCTGCGEYLTRTSLAKSIGQRLIKPCSGDGDVQASADTLGRTLQEDFVDSFLLAGVDQTRKIAGAIALKTESISDSELLVDFAYGHCSSDICLAYTVPGAKASDIKFRCLVSDCAEQSKIVAGGGLYRLSVKNVNK